MSFQNVCDVGEFCLHLFELQILIKLNSACIFKNKLCIYMDNYINYYLFR